jgi:tetratricopeptide (TPR) repeat protein
MITDNIQSQVSVSDYPEYSNEIPILVTSRLYISMQKPPLKVVILETLAAGPALSLFASVADIPQWPDESHKNLAQELCQVLGYHPQAICLAGGMMLEGQKSLPLLYKVLKDSPLAVAENEIEKVRIMLEESTRTLSLEARQVLFTFGAFYGVTLSTEMLSMYLNEPLKNLEASIHNLIRRNLMRRSPDNSYLRIHDLTYSFAKSQLDNLETARQRTQATILSYFHKHITDPDPLYLELNNILQTIQQLDLPARLDAMSRLVFAELENYVTSAFFNRFGRNYDFLNCLIAVLKTAKGNQNLDRPTIHFLFSKAGNSAFERGEYEQAAELYQSALNYAPTKSASWCSTSGGQSPGFCGHWKDQPAILTRLTRYKTSFAR